MVVSHNIQAMNAIRLANINISAYSDSTEKVSSGYKINRGNDYPAGLGISEKMRRQVRGLNQGIQNTKDGVNLCQIADGALDEVTEMLQRINELSIHAATGTLDETDRHYIQTEIEQILEEIDRIGDTTSFNEIPIFRGTDSLDKEAGNLAKPSTNGDFFKLFGNNISKTGYMTEALTPDDVTKSTSTMNTNYPYVSVHINMGKLNDLNNLIGTTFFVNCCTNCCPTTIKFTDTAGVTKNGKEIEIGLQQNDGSYYNNAEDFCEYIVDALSLPKNDISHVEFGYKDSTLYIYDIDNNTWSQEAKELAYFCDSEDIYETQGAGQKIWIQSGYEKDSGIWLEIDEMNTVVLGLKGINVTTTTGADLAIEQVKNALHNILERRSTIGAQQNRLEHTVTNEENISENVDASDSRIRDTDISSEMIRFSNLNILLQVGQTMISQANQNIEKLLNLL